MSGRHPVNLESSLEVSLRGLEVDGAWNKGKGGTGYVRFARSHGCRLVDSRLRGLRHLTFQWSASDNLVARSVIEADVNFHGGYAHHNRVEACTITPPPGHPWPAVVRTGGDAGWAPPDGPGNVVR